MSGHFTLDIILLNLLEFLLVCLNKKNALLPQFFVD